LNRNAATEQKQLTSEGMLMNQHCSRRQLLWQFYRWHVLNMRPFCYQAALPITNCSSDHPSLRFSPVTQEWKVTSCHKGRVM